MTHTIDAPSSPGPPPRAPMSTGDKVRFVLRGIGQTLITLGLVVLLFVVYEVWVTNWFADARNNHNISVLKKEFATRDAVSGGPTLPGTTVPTVKVGKGIGILYLPRLGSDYHEAIVQGSKVPDDDQLEQGTAHYGDTAMPGQVGNFAIAGHRVGKGQPFLNLDHLRTGDAVIVETQAYWYVYRVLGSPAGKDPQTVTATVATDNGSPVSIPGREIIEPDQGEVLDPVPDHPSVKASEALLTMTTCHPKFTASHRMIVYAKLAQRVPSEGDAMPAAVKALYDEGSS